MLNASEILSGIAFRTCSPTRAMMELTSLCNQACSFCYKEKNNVTSELGTTEIINLLKSLASMGVIYLQLTGGECLLREDIKIIIQRAHEYHFKISLFTNGFGIDREKAKWLAANGVMSVQLSLHAANAQLHDSLVGLSGSFEQIILAAKNLTHFGTKVFLACVVSGQNNDQITQLQDLAIHLDLNIRFDSRLLAPRRFFINSSWQGPNQSSVIETLFQSNAIDSFIKEPDGIPREFNNKLCSAGRTRIRIDEIGNVYPCEFLRMPVGNIREGGLQKVWRESEKLQWLRSLTFGQTRCVECKLLPYCAPCIGRHYEDTGDIFTPSPQVCWEASLRKRLMDERGLVPESLQQSSSPASADDVPACEIDS